MMGHSERVVQCDIAAAKIEANGLKCTPAEYVSECQRRTAEKA